MSEIKEQNSPLEIAKKFGLSTEEFNTICTLLKRVPNVNEISIFSAMWSEHCSYKSSKKWLKILPSEGEVVVHGPGENAGVIDIGDNKVAIFKIESHNHPSFIEPYQGAATGVGGILRDVFTMGARPVALLNALRFGSTTHSKTKYLLDGVVSGIGGYGNCIGIPTIGGETNFDESYNGNILVNAMAIGIASKDLSYVEVLNTSLNNVDLCLTSYQKKPEYGGASLLSINSNFICNEQYLLEENSDINVDSVKLPINTKKVSELLYGADYGTASDR